ncbi:trypco2 family protein [Nostoc favosum]|uniref:Trypsin-co-occurring domain-containing protein n=1 Tax=Nostoc favosum CHAB5714 TaxID=2780399 RepID=A0ABS8I6C4_9NOSO|nr:trypco2 family protein [Nostoc favosum]MCC5599416.1 hypothetical protein [Nostoc favosum CHAB5714]
MSGESNDIGLSELIAKVKEELANTNKESPVFFVEKIELELQVTISRDNETKTQGKAKAGWKIFVVSGGLEGSKEATTKMKRENIHKIKVTLTPAILTTEEIWKRIDPKLQKKISDSTSQTVIHGDDDKI